MAYVISDTWIHEHKGGQSYLYDPNAPRAEYAVGTYQWGPDITQARQFSTLTEAMNYAYKVWKDMSYTFRFTDASTQEVVFSGNNS